MLISFLISFVVNAVALYLVTIIVPGITANNFETILIAAVVFGIVNGLIKPVVQLISLPITILTFGVFAFIVNVVMFVLAASLVPGFDVEGVWAAVLGTIVLTIVGTILNYLTKGLKSATPAS